ncbi:MAG: orotidine-5'-phosphate decarboxylase [Cyanobacteria bacterium]|nr:orotidine-5'-phosphate decarboxylase [Cyanobacteriota bacterium]
MAKLSDRVIVALDVPIYDGAIALVDQLPEVSFWKVGLELFVSTGPAILKTLKDRNKRIFLDLKFHDIPNTMAGVARVAGRFGVDLFTVHASAGSDALRAVAEAAAAGAAETGMPAPNPIAVTALTSLTPRQLALELKISLELGDYALQMALLAQEAGLAGAVCSPLEAADLRRCVGPDFLLVCPGVRPAGTATGDQQRTLTPTQAFQAGADYLVMGRPVTAAPDPVAAWAAIAAELNRNE